jgi:hypothetical protein
MPADGLNQGSTTPETRELRTTARSSQYSRTLAEAETTFSLAASQQETGGGVRQDRTLGATQHQLYY